MLQGRQQTRLPDTKVSSLMVSFTAFQTSARKSLCWFNFHVFAAISSGVFRGIGSQLVIV